MDSVMNVHLTATEHDDRIIFLHNVEPGPASQSYGLQVAQLAGVPKMVIQQAKDKLHLLENDSIDSTIISSGKRFSSPTTPVSATDALNSPMQADMFTQGPSTVEIAIAELSADDLTPKQALDEIYRLKSLIG
jgi:DNA mismatch repair protein MutS